MCLFFLCELASLVVFSIQIYLLVDEGSLLEDAATAKADLRIFALICSALVLVRTLFFILQMLLIFFRLKY